MPYDRIRLENFAMEAEKTAKTLSAFGGTVEIDSIGNSLGFSSQDSRSIAKHLEDLGWVKIHAFEPIGTHANPKMTITPFGYEEIAKLRWPSWRRWVYKNVVIISLVALAVAIASLVVNIIRLFL